MVTCNPTPQLGPRWRPGLPQAGVSTAVKLDTPPPPAPSVIAVCSGKGGVGKSSIALNLAVALAADGERVGLLDADVHAPDIPLMVGLARHKPAHEWVLARAGGLRRTPLEPVECFGVQLMSTGFIVGESQAVAWSAELVSVLLNQLIWSTTWGELDRLVIDLPPGTSDITQAIMRLLPTSVAVVIVTPQDVAHLDTRRLLVMLDRVRVPVVGGIENMSGLTCPCCRTQLEVFAPVPESRSVWSTGLSRLGTVPLAVADGTTQPEPVVLTASDTPRAVALREASTALRKAIADRGGQA